MVKGKEPGRETSEDSVTATAGPGVTLVASSTSIGDSGTALSSYLSDGTKPYQPHPQFIEPQTLANRVLTFQERWFHDFPWLHYNPSIKGVLCFHCSQGFSSQPSFGQRADAAFISAGFRNWRKAIEKFTAHQNCQTHRHFVTVTAHQLNPISAQLSSAWGKQQEDARHCLMKIVSSVRHVVRQGQAFRGHTDDSGNLYQLLKLRAEEDDLILLKWLTDRTTMYTGRKAQNEILNIMVNTVIRGIAAYIRSLRIVQFSVVVDGTKDVSAAEQESVCLPYVDHVLVPLKEFIGLYRVLETTGEGIAKVATDVLLRLNLPMSGLRGQSYDGDSKHGRKIHRCTGNCEEAAAISPLCALWSTLCNLITQAGCTASPLIRDSLSWVHQLGVLYGQSGKFKSMFESIATSKDTNLTTLKPLCPTRWTVRNTAIRAVLGQYERVLSSLEEMAKTASKTASTASGLFEHFSKGKTVLGLTLASAVLGELECLNISLQKKTQTVSGMQAAVECVRSSLRGKRNDESYLALYEKATTLIDSIESIETHSRRFAGKAVDHYRAEFF